MNTNNTEYIVSQDGKELKRFKTEFEALLFIQRSQGQSFQWATTYGGWKLEEKTVKTQEDQQ